MNGQVVRHLNRAFSHRLSSLPGCRDCRFWQASLVLAAAAITVVAEPDLAWTPFTTAELPKDAIKIELFEGVPDQASWNFVPPPPSEAYAEPVFAFPVLPTRYSKTGIKVDRAAPFVFRASALITLPEGDHRLLLRARTGSRLKMDDQIVLTTRFPNLNADGHEEVPQAPLAVTPNIRYLRPGHFESITNLQFDGRPHLFTLEAVIGSKNRRPEPGELSVSYSSADDQEFWLLAPNHRRIPLTDEGWMVFEGERRAFHAAEDAKRRRAVSGKEDKYWRRRHELARAVLADANAPLLKPKVPGVSPSMPAHNDVDRFIGARLDAAKISPAPLLDDWAFLRRVTLDVIGVIPTTEQLSEFSHDPRDARRAKAIDRLLDHPRWADHWVGYWQDVLAENPGILKPMLNNTGPFRWWLHEAFTDNKSMDRLATELISMEGSVYYGGPGGFSMASENDVPLAQKAQIVAQAFMGMQMQCARCHDAPYHQFKQKDLFSLAAMLRREPQPVPLSSSIPTNANIVIGRLVNVTLSPGDIVEPEWPLPDVTADELPPGVLRNPHDSRERLAALITNPRNSRFAKVTVNRLWKRYLGWGIVEPVDDWEHAKPSHPELLDWLAHEFMTHGYDLKHVARLILNSHTYQRTVIAEGSHAAKPQERLFASPARRRLSAEQIVDSLFAAVGKSFAAEEMNLDVDGRRPVKDFNNLGTPQRAWEFTSLSNERDRPALAMPKAQAIVDTLITFGWRESRQSPLSVRDHEPNVLQPAVVANSLVSYGRVTRLSDDSAITTLALEHASVESLVQAIFLRLLSRPPGRFEMEAFTAHLAKGFEDRRVQPSAARAYQTKRAPRPVSWSNHLNPEATTIKQELERETRAGDPPTEQLRPDWRGRMEDMLWVLVNSPEFIFVP